jgi:DNA-directed RNA polymerase subunit RPC12/RpoP
MPVSITCPACDRQRVVPDDCVGKSVRCQGCHVKFTADPPRSSSREEPDDEPIRRRSSRRDDDEPRSRRDDEPAGGRRSRDDEDGDDGGRNPAISFPCPKCAADLRVKGSKAGKRIRCPECDWRIDVPDAEGEEPASEVVDGENPAVNPVANLFANLAAGGVCLGAVALLGFCCVGIFSSGSSDPKAASAQKPIPYDVLISNKNNSGKIRLDILVQETATKEEVLKLAAHLLKEYDGRYSIIDIFDAREAWQSREDDDETYPQSEYFRHWLVHLDALDLKSDPRMDLWAARGRDH